MFHAEVSSLQNWWLGWIGYHGGTAPKWSFRLSWQTPCGNHWSITSLACSSTSFVLAGGQLFVWVRSQLGFGSLGFCRLHQHCRRKIDDVNCTWFLLNRLQEIYALDTYAFHFVDPLEGKTKNTEEKIRAPFTHKELGCRQGGRARYWLDDNTERSKVTRMMRLSSLVQQQQQQHPWCTHRHVRTYLTRLPSPPRIH